MIARKKVIILKDNYSQQLDFWQGAARMKQPECIQIHEDCELSGNIVKNLIAKSNYKPAFKLAIKKGLS